MKVVIAGGGQTLYFLCRSFVAKGYGVVLVNRSREECLRLARQLTATVVWGDASDASTLEEAGARGADVVLAITPHDQDNLVICQLAAVQFGVPRTLALANDPDNVASFEQLGVPAFSTTPIVGSLIEQRASLEEIVNLLPVAEGRVNVTEIVIAPDFPVAGRRLKDIALPENALVAVVMRNHAAIVPRGGSQLLPGDRVVLITLPENHAAVLKSFTGAGQ